jgi:hypothetical protein
MDGVERIGRDRRKERKREGEKRRAGWGREISWYLIRALLRPSSAGPGTRIRSGGGGTGGKTLFLEIHDDQPRTRPGTSSSGWTSANRQSECHDTCLIRCSFQVSRDDAVALSLHMPTAYSHHDINATPGLTS